MTREAWLRARQGEDGQFFLGGSDAATVLGWSSWEDPVGLWGRKLGLIPRSDGDTEAAEAGRMFEDSILRWYGRRTSRELIMPGRVALLLNMARECPYQAPETYMSIREVELTGMMLGAYTVHYGPDDDGQVIFRSKSRPWALLTPDAFAFDEDLGGWGVVDAKNLNASKAAEWADGVPPDKSPQMAFYTADAPFAWGGFAVVFGGQQLKVYDLKRSTMEPLYELLLSECEDFIQSLEARERPGAAASAASAAALRALYPQPDARRVRGWAGVVQMADGTTYTPGEFDETWTDVAAKRAELREARDQLEAVLRHVARGAGQVRLPSGAVYTLSPSIRRKNAR